MKSVSKYEVTTKSSEETQRLSEKLGELVEAQDVIILEGDLESVRRLYKGTSKRSWSEKSCK